MAHHTIVIGSGPSGMAAALLLVRKGHRVTLVDRDSGPRADQEWDRIGVMQFHLPHSLRGPGRLLLQERLPDMYDALLAAGAEVRAAPGMPEAMAGLAARRSVFERAMWEHTTREPGVRRMTGHVDEVVVVGRQARGVVVDGQFVPADLVVDASGRAGRLGAEHRPLREGGATGFAYAARQYQLLPGATPGPVNGGPGLIVEHDRYAELVFAHDRGTFSVLIVRAADDPTLADLRHEAAFEAALSLLPASSAWTDPARSYPLSGVRAGAGLTNHYQGQATGISRLLAIGDAVCTTNPAGARGLTMGLRSAVAMVDIVTTQEPDQWATSLDDWSTTHLRPWFEEQVIADAWQRESWAGRTTDPACPVPWNLVAAAATEHPEWMPVLGPFLGMMTGPESLDPLREQVRQMVRDGWQPAPPEGPAHDVMVAAVRGQLVSA